MLYPICHVRYGPLTLEWNEPGDLRIIRADNGQHIELSLTEWILLLKVAELHGWPVAPPQSVGGANRP